MTITPNWYTLIRRLRGKKSSITYSIKDSAGIILTVENETLSRCRKYFRDFFNPVKTSTHNTPKVIHLGKVEAFTAAEMAMEINGIKSVKAAW